MLAETSVCVSPATLRLRILAVQPDDPAKVVAACKFRVPPSVCRPFKVNVDVPVIAQLFQVAARVKVAAPLLFKVEPVVMRVPAV